MDEVDRFYDLFAELGERLDEFAYVHLGDFFLWSAWEKEVAARFMVEHPEKRFIAWGDERQLNPYEFLDADDP